MASDGQKDFGSLGTGGVGEEVSPPGLAASDDVFEPRLILFLLH